MCLVVFQKMFRKIFSDVWLCSWKYHRKHIFYLLLTFSTCCLHFLTFSRLPNDYIISFIPQNTNKTQKKSIGEIVIGKIMIGTIAIEAVGTSREDRPGDRDRRYHASRWCQRTMMSRSILSLFLFYFPRPEVLWSENRNGKLFPLFWLSNSVNWKCFSVCISVWSNLK